MQSFFITAPGTGIGKTLVTTALCWQLRQQGKTVTALKPVITGYDASDPENDTALILKSCGLAPTPQLMETVSPWRFSAPLAPGMAAAREGKTIDIEALTGFCREHAGLQSDVVLVEGAGGVMAPLSDAHTALDWIEALGWPVILVAGSYLGALSHTLTALEALRGRDVAVRAIAVSESAGGSVSLDGTVRALEKFIPATTPIAKLPRLTVRRELWKAAPLVSWMINES